MAGPLFTVFLLLRRPRVSLSVQEAAELECRLAFERMTWMATELADVRHKSSVLHESSTPDFRRPRDGEEDLEGVGIVGFETHTRSSERPHERGFRRHRN